MDLNKQIQTSALRVRSGCPGSTGLSCPRGWAGFGTQSGPFVRDKGRDAYTCPRNRHHVMQVHIERTELGQTFEDFSQQIAHK
ncbi:hypothetical protein GRJ2_001941300 [Grus japonensis]|uniref:Uncharacterized protein n=1 Tax=Grus japonensis TaxID=30415 RepID=A0ABC9XCB1_GRUJA